MQVFVNDVWFYTYFYGGSDKWDGGDTNSFDKRQSWPSGLTYFNMQENGISFSASKGDACNGTVIIYATMGSGDTPKSSPKGVIGNFSYEKKFGADVYVNGKWVSNNNGYNIQGSSVNISAGSGFYMQINCDSGGFWDWSSEGTRTLTVYPWGK